MKYLITLILALLLFFNTPAQNLIQNAGFDSVSFCPSTLQNYMAPYPFYKWRERWTADAFHTCANWPVNPNWNTFGSATGTAFAGMWGVDNSGFINWETIVQDVNIVPGIYKLGLDGCLSDWKYGQTKTPLAISFVVGVDTIYTDYFTDTSWTSWDSLVYLNGGDSIEITVSKIGTYTIETYIWLDNIELIPQFPLDSRNKPKRKPIERTGIFRLQKRYDLLGREK